MSAITHPLTVYLPDTRGVQLSRYGMGNLKIGLGVFTYSKLPGSPVEIAIGACTSDQFASFNNQGTCPGSTPECRAIC